MVLTFVFAAFALTGALRTRAPRGTRARVLMATVPTACWLVDRSTAATCWDMSFEHRANVDNDEGPVMTESAVGGRIELSLGTWEVQIELCITFLHDGER